MASSNDKSFLLTSNPHIRQKRDKWCTCINRRPNKSSLEGKRINSTAFRTRIGAESELFEFCYSKESKESKILIAERARELKSVPLDVFIDDADDGDTLDLPTSNNSLPVESASSNQMPPGEQESTFKTKGVFPQKNASQKSQQVAQEETRANAAQVS